MFKRSPEPLVDDELDYLSSDLQFLALKWAVCKHFRYYLFCFPHFYTYADYNPLTYIKNTCKFNATGQRWTNGLAFHYSLQTWKCLKFPNELFAAAEFSKTQMEDETIARVIQLKRKSNVLATSEKIKASKKVRMFFRDMEKMNLSDGDVLYRHTNDKQQLVLLKKLIPLQSWAKYLEQNREIQ